MESAKRYVQFMGGADSVLAQARESFEQGDYRWVVQVVNHLVFADPDNEAARALQADALEQLGYQSESATWRNAYLVGAMELRGGVPPVRPVHRKEMAEAITLEQLVDTMGIRLQSENVGGVEVRLAVELTDSNERGVIGLENRALNYVDGPLDDPADNAATLRATKGVLTDLAVVATTFDEALEAGAIEVDDAEAARIIFDNLDTHYTGFNIVTP